MAQKAQKSVKGKKPAGATKKKIMPLKKMAVKKKKNVGKKPAIVKKVIKVIVKEKKVKEKKIKKIKVDESKEIKKVKKPVPVFVPHEFRVNIHCRNCSLVDGYTSGEKVCHNCKKEIYEIDKI